jgi:hypothetical protein
MLPSLEPDSPFLRHVESSVQNLGLVSVSLSCSPLMMLRLSAYISPTLG